MKTGKLLLFSWPQFGRMTKMGPEGIRPLEKSPLKEHNRGPFPHTEKYKPWGIETAIAFASQAKARAFEKYLKSGSGREFARRHF